MNREFALECAQRVLDVLAPGCESLAVAGSIRRGKEEVKDIEIVCSPILEEVETDLFSVDLQPRPLLARIAAAIEKQIIAYDPITPRNGYLYKRFRVCVHPGEWQDLPALDLFIANSQNYGNILAIRTGSAIFSKALMYRARKFGMLQKDGYLWRDGQIISCPTEKDYFNALCLDWIPPEDRTEQAAELVWMMK